MSTHTEGARRRARELLFRLAYQADLMGERYANVWKTAREGEHLSADQLELIDDVMKLLEGRSAEVDEIVGRAAQHWELERLAATDRSVLRTATAELLSRPGTPVRVVLDEAIDIAKRFGSEESGRFVNGVLDRVARALRPEEL
ncbi:MAG TPA: transcription antitermination factor NusB [Candidatus Limnocylindria bacterium]|nr:transcription antitermination factor NusB [Candidatus Limnocylindria bacterium]